MFKKIAAIDIGSTSIKLIKAEQKIKSLNIISISSEPIEQGVERNVAVSNAMEYLLSKENFENFTVIANIPSDLIVLRTLEFPFSDAEKISNVISIEAEEKLPYPVDETLNDFQYLKSIQNTRVLFAAAEIKAFEEFMSIFKDLSISLNSITIDCNALFECFNYFQFETGNVIQIDFGHSKTTVNFISANELIYTRSISTGISSIIEIISDLLKISLDDAESLFKNIQIDIANIDANFENEIYKSYKLSKAKFLKVKSAIQEVFTEILNEVKLTEKSIYAEYGEIYFSKVIISGGGAIITGIEEFVTDTISIKTSRLEFLPQFNDLQIRTRFCSSFGLILSYLNKSTKKINFLKDNSSNGNFNFNIKSYQFAVCISAFAIIALLFSIIINSIFNYTAKKSDETALRNYFSKSFQSELKESDDPVQSARDIVSAQKKELSSVKSILPSDLTIIKKIEGITANFEMDESFTLTDLTVDEKNIKISGETMNSQNIDVFKNNLLKSGQYESVTLNTNMSSGKITKFSIQIKLKQ